MKIKITNHTYECTDGCCYEEWATISVDGVILTETFDGTTYEKRFFPMSDGDPMRAILEHLGYAGIEIDVCYDEEDDG
jgi:hypothetical protein